MCKSQSMTSKVPWCVCWSWGISLRSITPIGQRRCIGTAAIEFGESVASGVYFYTLTVLRDQVGQLHGDTADADTRQVVGAA